MSDLLRRQQRHRIGPHLRVDRHKHKFMLNRPRDQDALKGIPVLRGQGRENWHR